jgi:Ca2+-binding RTX toxin-like protein
MRFALVALVFLALAAPARASTAQVVIADSCGSDVACSKYAGGHPVPVVTYAAAAGEANRLTVSRLGDQWTLSDPGAAIAVGDGCRSVDAHTAACTAANGPEPVFAFSAQLGDGDDALTVAGPLLVRGFIDGGPDDDTLTGGPDSDTFDGGPGADRIDGGGGNFDTLTFAGRPTPVTVDVGARRTSDGDTFAGIEGVDGGDGADRLLGGPGADTLGGGPGKDEIFGRGGDDELEGGLGADRIEGGPGADQAAGDPPQGDDYYTPRIHLSADVIRGGPGNDGLRDSGGANRIDGGPGNDAVDGGDGPDLLLGRDGADSMSGGGGRDDLRGGAGADRLFGGDGGDRLTGGAGADLLRGEYGADRLAGGSGKDRLSGGRGPDRLLARDGRRELVDCGRGHGRDRARVDARDRVLACEKTELPKVS